MIKVKTLLTSFVCCVVSLPLFAQPVHHARKSLLLMGSAFELAATANKEEAAWRAVEEGIREIRRIEQCISSWDPHSQTSKVNRFAGIKPVKVDQELYELIYRAQKVAALTDGAFDISFASMDKIWHFDGTEQSLPDSTTVATARSKINFRHIHLNQKDTTVFLAQEGMKIGFGAIGKGYAANRAKRIMQAVEGVQGGAVNASGDLLAWGQGKSERGYRVSIANPKDQGRPIAWLLVKDLAVVTSGNYEKYFTSGGKRYAHIINPQTGYPTSGVSGVTVLCPDAELADALATSIFVMGVKRGLRLSNQLKGVECLIIDDCGEIHRSEYLKLNYY